jgi:hypothetical protein
LPHFVAVQPLIDRRRNGFRAHGPCHRELGVPFPRGPVTARRVLVPLVVILACHAAAPDAAVMAARRR